MSPWDFPPEYGIEEGERCGRGRCSTRICYEPIECEPLDCEDEDCDLDHEGHYYCPSGCWDSRD